MDTSKTFRTQKNQKSRTQKSGVPASKALKITDQDYRKADDHQKRCLIGQRLVQELGLLGQPAEVLDSSPYLPHTIGFPDSISVRFSSLIRAHGHPWFCVELEPRLTHEGEFNRVPWALWARVIVKSVEALRASQVHDKACKEAQAQARKLNQEFGFQSSPMQVISMGTKICLELIAPVTPEQIRVMREAAFKSGILK